MEMLDLFIKYAVLFSATFFIIFKVINFKGATKRQYIIVTIIAFLAAINYAIISSTNQLVAFLFAYLILTIGSKIILKKKLSYSFLITLFSYTIAFVNYAIACLLLMPISFIIFNNELPTFLDYRIVDMITIIFIYCFLKTKKIKHGFSFLKNDEKIEYLGNIIVIVCSIIIFSSIVAHTLVITDESLNFPRLTFYFVLLLLLVGTFIVIWVKREINNHYFRLASTRTIENQQKIIQEQIEEISKLNEIAIISHKTNHEIDMLRARIEEMSPEDALSELCQLSNKYSDDIRGVGNKKMLPLTNIPELDKVLIYMQRKAEKCNIDFILKISGSIHYMTKTIIDQERLATLLSDHIKDAIIAVKSRNNSFKSITILLGEIDDHYGLSIHDTGVSFTIKTLINLGLKPVTTNAKSGGTGLGFMTTFKTLKETNASLIINEKRPSKEDYTKSVNIIFDNKKEYIIDTYRATKIKEADREKRINVIAK